MAKLKIFTFPDQVLAQRAKPIERVGKELFGVADDMLETMYDAPGIGLAANQVGLLQRLIVVDTDYDIYEPGEGEAPPPNAEVVGGLLVTGKNPRILANPEIIHREGETTFNEGCLSVPEYNAEVRRAEKIRVRYQDIDGLSRTLDAEGLLAICIQHELDHLDGKLFIDRLSPSKKDAARRRLKREREQREAEILEKLRRAGY
jgi:peptide deformylase